MDVAKQSARWSKLLPGQRRWLVLNAVLLAAGTNLVVNALIAWVSVRTMRTVPMWAVPLLDKPSMITDTVGTFLLLPLTTCLICTTAVRIELRRSRLNPLRLGDLGSLLARLPEGRLPRGAVLAVTCAAVLSPVAVVILVLTDFGGVSRAEFIAHKAALSVALGAVVTPLIALRAMADCPPE